MRKGLFRKLALVFLILLLAIPSSVLGKVNEKASEKASTKVNENSNRPHLDPQGDTPNFRNVSVHDPSIIKHEDMYYVFGSHIDAARSKDLISWERFTNGYTTPDNVLFGDLSENLAGSFKWAGENDSDSRGGFAVWAPEVFWNEHYVNGDGSKGAYMNYYSASSTYIRSAIGFAVSKEIEGPYEYVDTIVYSGFTREDAKDLNSDVNKKWDNTNIKQLIEDGTLQGTRDGWFNNDGSYNNNLFPNAIDANIFYDTDGRMWMTYGSWSGGLFLLELDKETGRPIYPGKDGTTHDGRMIDRYFGTKIAGGYYQSGEGPYVVYDKNTGYYYLYVTYGWLGQTGGYNMRLFRSTSPEGPYLDASGQSAVLPGRVDNSPYGNKVMGNFLFERKVGDPGTGIGVGYMAPGHNSAYIDPETGEHFLVFHTRFQQTGEMHEVRVHHMFMNSEGWPVAAPYRYTGEKLEKVNRQDLVGEYKFINHGMSYSGAINKSVFIKLTQDGLVTGDVTGTWEKEGHNNALITIGGKVYNGVFVRQWDPTSGRYVMTFTALSNEGVTIWGSKLQDKTDQELIEDVKNDLDLGDTNQVISNLSLPTEGTRHSVITWETSDESVVTTNGEITRPDPGSSSKTATLTATISKGDVTDKKTFVITVLPYKEKGLVAHYTFEGDLTDSNEQFGAGTLTGDRINNTGGSISYTDGVSGKAAVFNGASGIRLPNGLISSHSYSVSLWLKPEQLTNFTTTFFGAKSDSSWISLVPSNWAGQTMVWSNNDGAWYDALTGLTIKTNEWTHMALTVDNGKIIVYVNGVKKFEGNNFNNVFTTPDASFALGVNYWDIPFKGQMDELRIYEGALVPEEIVKLAQGN